jgi:hypothetical protein
VTVAFSGFRAFFGLSSLLLVTLTISSVNFDHRSHCGATQLQRQHFQLDDQAFLFPAIAGATISPGLLDFFDNLFLLL